MTPCEPYRSSQVFCNFAKMRVAYESMDDGQYV